ncbi:hypothetical protein DFH29DRAFT_999994 [Suillus ampliporus]|nr:hypothetical protein DFH29DRAFT_999994 [Suillus ampliporus]
MFVGDVLGIFRQLSLSLNISISPKVLAVRAHIDRLDDNDFDGTRQYVTDDFVYEAESKPPGVLGEIYGDEAGIDQVSLKAFREKIAGHLTFKTIENITENPETGNVIVVVKAKYQQSVVVDASLYWGGSIHY